jgi:hypothetical protein
MISLSVTEDGDVVVRIVQVAARASYVLCVVPGEGQFAYADRQEATAKAVAYAERTRVNAWYADVEDRFEVLAAFRAPSASGSGNLFALP